LLDVENATLIGGLAQLLAPLHEKQLPNMIGKPGVPPYMDSNAAIACRCMVLVADHRAKMLLIVKGGVALTALRGVAAVKALPSHLPTTISAVATTAGVLFTEF